MQSLMVSWLYIPAFWRSRIARWVRHVCTAETTPTKARGTLKIPNMSIILLERERLRLGIGAILNIEKLVCVSLVLLDGRADWERRVLAFSRRNCGQCSLEQCLLILGSGYDRGQKWWNDEETTLAYIHISSTFCLYLHSPLVQTISVGRRATWSK